MKLLRSTWLPTVEQGCCCSLEICCKVQGYLAAISSLLTIIGCISFWNADHSDWPHPNPPVGAFPVFYILQTYGYVVAITVVTFIADGIIGFPLAVIFLAGVYNGRHAMITPYVWLLYWRVILTIHYAIFIGIFVPVLSLLVTLPMVGFSGYLLVCANSLRDKLLRSSGAHERLDWNPLENPTSTAPALRLHGGHGGHVNVQA